MRELRHFFTFQNGPGAMARIDFSDLTSVVQVRVVVEMEIQLANSNTWDNFTEDVQKLLNYNGNHTVNAL